jgi:hypothetical protein
MRKTDEELADEVARLVRLSRKINDLLSWRKSVLQNRMRAQGVVRMKTPSGTVARFVPQHGFETSDTIVGERLDVKGANLGTE